MVGQTGAGLRLNRPDQGPQDRPGMCQQRKRLEKDSTCWGVHRQLS